MTAQRTGMSVISVHGTFKNAYLSHCFQNILTAQTEVPRENKFNFFFFFSSCLHALTLEPVGFV